MGYLPYDIDQRLLLPPDMRAWLPEGHLALFLLDVVAEPSGNPRGMTHGGRSNAHTLAPQSSGRLERRSRP
jgi:hypothetical protein